MSKSEFALEFQRRTMRFAVDVIRFSAKLPDRAEFWDIRRQLVRSASSVAANYRAACRAQSRAAFVAKLSIVEEEGDESAFWLEVLDQMKTRENDELKRLHVEVEEIVRIVVKSKKTAKSNSGKPSSNSTFDTRHSTFK
ncbi:MAG: hypothetical protein BIFFINMI_01388 [Phycisphaerae bacterium]|nr:hypothetical protein [Phycisphaerae bacterium]